MSSPYTLRFTDKTAEAMERLDKATAHRIMRKLEWLAANIELAPHETLAGQWAGHYRWRVGDYRVIYTLDHEIHLLRVVKIGHRSNVYDK